ncbi:hypothetical protein DFH06DRAFT_1173592 [Mycena polygramma]|nr:hypothetical protein DFH06DRAFT_1173592 [Mycena polygramma]
MPLAVELQQLLSLRTLQDVEVTALSEHGPQTFFTMLERCSPAVRNLRLDMYSRMPTPESPVHAPAAPITLTSLHVSAQYEIDHRLLLALSPFTFSNLRALWLIAHSIQWRHIMIEMKTIKVLRIDTQDTHTGLDLCAFPQLSLLCLDSTSLIVASTEIRVLLPTIRAAHHIRTIRLAVLSVSVGNLHNICDMLDESLSFTQVSGVEIELPAEQPPDQVAKYFRRLSAMNKLRIGPHNPDSWEDAVRRL